MYFAINHKIHNQLEFWNTIEKIKNNLSSEVKNYAILPNIEMDEAITIWKTLNQFQLEFLIEEQTGDFSRNVYFQIDEKNAIGLLRLNS
jgi:hypothetical protein